MWQFGKKRARKQLRFGRFGNEIRLLDSAASRRFARNQFEALRAGDLLQGPGAGRGSRRDMALLSESDPGQERFPVAIEQDRGCGPGSAPLERWSPLLPGCSPSP